MRQGLSGAIGSLLLAASLACPGHGASQPAAPARATVVFDPADPAHAELYALERAAVALDIDHATPAQLPAVKAAWTALRERALATRLRDGSAHPLAGRATIMLALAAQMGDDYPTATALATEGVAMLEPFRDQYQPFYAHGRTMLGFFRFVAGDAAGALAILEPNVAFLQLYYDALPPAQRIKEIEIQRADGEYALGGALARLGRMEQAAAAQKRSSEAMAAGLGADDGHTLLSVANYAVLLGRAGHVERAAAIAREVVERTVAVLPRTDPSYPRILAFTGLMLARNGLRVQGSDYLSAALANMRETGNRTTLGYSQFQQSYGTTLSERELYPEALAALQDAVAAFREIGSPLDVSKAQSLVGLARFAQNDPAAADDLDQAIAGSRAIDATAREVSQMSLPVLIVAEVDRGRLAVARDHARRFAADIAELEGSKAFLVADAATLAGYVEWRAAPGAAVRERAAAAARQLIAVVGDNRLLAATGDLPQRERAALDLTLRVAAETRNPALALEAMTTLAGSRIAQANRLLVDRLAVADPALGERIRGLQDAIRAAQAADAGYVAALGSDTDVVGRRAERDRTAAAATAMRAALAHDYPRWDEANAVQRVDLATVQRELAPGEAVLGVLPAFDGVYVLAIGARHASIHRTTLGRAAIVDLVGRVRRSLPAGSFDTAAAHSLYRQLFTADTRPALVGATALRIVATGPLAALPFATLLERPAARADRTAPYLIRRYALKMAPGFSTMPAARENTAATRFLGVGAATPFPKPATVLAAVMPAAGYFRGGAGDARALGALPVLPSSAAELRAVAARIGSQTATLLVGDEASEARLRAMTLTDYSVILFATHGLVSGEMEGLAEPALVLAPPGQGAEGDGLLTASEIAMLRLAADWVILSACNTAAGDGAASPAYSGLAQAFRYAGARSLLLSHWPVRDDAAARISIATVGNARAGMRREVALQRAMLALLADRRFAGGDDPYIWAPYVLID